MKKTRKKHNLTFKEKIFEFPQEHNILPVQSHKLCEEQKELQSRIFPDNGKLKQTSEKEGLPMVEKKRAEGVDPFIAKGIVDVADAFHFIGSIGIFF